MSVVSLVGLPAIMGKDIPGGILGNIIAGIVGSWVGTAILGHWGPQLGKILPSVTWFNYFNLFNFISFTFIQKEINNKDKLHEMTSLRVIFFAKFIYLAYLTSLTNCSNDRMCPG